MEVRKATSADVPALTAMLARAFDADPYASWFVRKDARREEGMRQYFRISLEHITLPHDEVWTTPELEGAAMWCPPGKWKLGLLQEIALASEFAVACGPTRLLDVFFGTNPVLKKHPRTPHWYLFVLGVDPAHQGRGISRALLAPVLARCDEEKVGAYLETSNENNLRVYRQFGFDPIESLVMPRGGPRTWLLWRDPH